MFKITGPPFFDLPGLVHACANSVLHGLHSYLTAVYYADIGLRYRAHLDRYKIDRPKFCL